VCLIYSKKVWMFFSFSNICCLKTYFTHPQAILGVYDFLLLGLYKQRYKENVLALPNFIMPVNGCWYFAHKSKSIPDKSAPHASAGLMKAFWSEAIRKISIFKTLQTKSFQKSGLGNKLKLLRHFSVFLLYFTVCDCDCETQIRE